MTKPGPMDWATSDVWASGPDVGDDTKLEPTAGQKGEGYYTGVRASPQIMNFMLNRCGLLQRSAARARASAYIRMDTTHAMVANPPGGNAYTVCYAYDQLNGTHYAFIPRVGGADYWEFIYAVGTDSWDGIVGFQGCNQTIINAEYINADGSHDGRVMICGTNRAGAGHVRYADTPGAFATPATPPPVGTNWQSIACDRDTAGFGSARWIVAESLNAGTPGLYFTTTTPPVFAAVAGFPALGAGGSEEIMGIWHSLHPAGALGPDDPGNPTWLVMTDTYAVRSTDGIVWTSAAHGLTLSGTSFDDRRGNGAAYSRIGNRWVISYANHIAYSDDNGATWTNIPNACPDLSSQSNMACDGYGTFVAGRLDVGGVLPCPIYVSVDNGLSWERTGLGYDTTQLNSSEGTIGYALDASKNIDDQHDFPAIFLWLLYDSAGGPYFGCYRSLDG